MDSSSYPVSISPLPFQAGKPLSVVYDASHPQAKIVNEDTLYVTVKTYYWDWYEIQRYVMQRTDKMHFEYQVMIPDSAVNVSISVCPFGEYIHAEHFSCAVYRNDDPVMGALPYVIEAASSYEEAERFVRQDKKLYPISGDRYLALWRGVGFEDSKYENIGVTAHELYTNAMENGIVNDYAALTASACYYMNTHAYGRVLNVCGMVRQWLDKGGSISLQHALAYHTIWNNVAADYATASVEEKDTLLHIARTIVDISTRLKDMSLAGTIARTATMPINGEIVTDIREMLLEDSIYARMLATVDRMSVDDVMRDGTFLFYMTQIIKKRGDDDAFIRTVERLLPALDTTVQWVRKDKSKRVSLFQQYGLESYLKYSYAEKMLDRGHASVALPMMIEMINRDINVYIEDAMEKSAETLARYYMTQKQCDSAVIYCGIANVLETEHADEIYTKLRKTFGGNVPEKSAMIAAHYRPGLIIRRKVKPFELHGEHGVYHPGKKGNDTTYVLFLSSESCSICDRIIPVNLEALSDVRENVKIFVLDDGSFDRMRERFPLPDDVKYEYAKMNQRIRKNLGVKGYPDHYVIKGNEIVSYGGVSLVTHEIIRKTLK